MDKLEAAAAAAAITDFLSRISNPESLHKLHNNLLFKGLADMGNLSITELSDLHALSDLLVSCHAIWAAGFPE